MVKHPVVLKIYQLGYLMKNHSYHNGRSNGLYQKNYNFILDSVEAMLLFSSAYNKELYFIFDSVETVL